MSTRPIVEQAISAIEDNGNNTAFEVRDVLTKMLDYTENEDPVTPTPVDFFHFFNNGDPMNNGSADLYYSFKGVVNGTVNLTFHLDVQQETSFLEEFQLEPGLMDVLTSIMESEMPLSFTVPYFRSLRESWQHTTMILTFGFANGTIRLNFPELDIHDRFDRLTTSIHFHMPIFNIG